MKIISATIMIIVSMMLCFPTPDHAAGLSSETHFFPYISTQEEFSDNIDLASRDKRADFITTVSPGLRFSRSDAMSGLDLDYNLGSVRHNTERDRDFIRQQGSLSARYLAKEHLNLYLKDSFVRSDEQRELEPFTPEAEERYLLSVAPERAVYWRNVAEPAMEYRFGPENRALLVYRNNTYHATRPGGRDSQENCLNSLFDYWYDKRNGIHLECGYTVGSFEQSPDMEAEKADLRYTHRFSRRAAVFGEYALTRRRFEASPAGYDIHEPSVGMTYAFSPALNTSVQIGYFRKNPTIGPGADGLLYRASITDLYDQRTTCVLSLQGGYTEDFFTSENLGFRLYHRLTGSVTHLPWRRTSIGLSGSVERVESDPGREDWMTGVSAAVAYTPLKWLTVTLECSHRVRSSSIDVYDYAENRGIIRITTGNNKR